MSPTSTFDVEKIREEFPILKREVYGKPLVYLDNAASAQKPRAVLDVLNHLYENDYSNVHRGLHYLSSASTLAYEEAREKVRAFINAKSEQEIIFTSGGTDAINLVSSSYGAALSEGDEIILSIMEHHSNIVPWFYLKDRKGAVLKWAPIDGDDQFDIGAFEKLLSNKTKIVAVTLMSNVLGTVTPLKEIVRLAHQAGAIVVVDACQAAVHMPLDVQDLDCDFLAMTSHKLYGPTGVGVLYGKLDLLKQMPPYRGGGEMIQQVTTEKVTFAEPPNRFEAGTPPIAEAIGLGAALDFISGIGHEAIRQHEQALLENATSQLEAMNSVRIIGRAQGKGAILSFELEGAHAHDVATIMDREGVAVRAGHHCAQPLMDHFGVASTARASFGLYNTHQEVDVLVASIRQAAEFFG